MCVPEASDRLSLPKGYIGDGYASTCCPICDDMSGCHTTSEIAMFLWCFIQDSWKAQLRQRLSNVRRPLSQVKRCRKEFGEGKEYETVQLQWKRSKSTQDKSTTETNRRRLQKPSGEATYWALVGYTKQKNYQAANEIYISSAKSVDNGKDAPTVAMIHKHFPCLKESKYVSTGFLVLSLSDPLKMSPLHLHMNKMNSAHPSLGFSNIWWKGLRV